MNCESVLNSKVKLFVQLDIKANYLLSTYHYREKHFGVLISKLVEFERCMKIEFQFRTGSHH